MLINPRDILKQAQKKRKAIGAFNAYNLETAKGIIEAAEELGAPVIVETTPKAIQYAGLENISQMVIQMAHRASVPIALHLDHGLSIEQVEECLGVGYTSVMIDGSHLPLWENIALTKRVREIASRYNVPVEGELGTVAKEVRYTNPAEVKDFIKQTGIFSLAVSIGSSHGHAAREKLDIDLLIRIREKTDVPLVLHGASGVSNDDIKQAIHWGICKINIDTQIREVFTEAVRECLKDSHIIDPREYLEKATSAVKKLVKEKILLFGSHEI